MHSVCAAQVDLSMSIVLWTQLKSSENMTKIYKNETVSMKISIANKNLLHCEIEKSGDLYYD